MKKNLTKIMKWERKNKYVRNFEESLKKTIKRVGRNETNRSKREQIKITTMEVNGRNNERTIT